MLQIETTFHDFAVSSASNCLIVEDRSIIVATAYLKPRARSGKDKVPVWSEDRGAEGVWCGEGVTPPRRVWGMGRWLCPLPRKWLII